MLWVRVSVILKGWSLTLSTCVLTGAYKNRSTALLGMSKGWLSGDYHLPYVKVVISTFTNFTLYMFYQKIELLLPIILSFQHLLIRILCKYVFPIYWHSLCIIVLSFTICYRDIDLLCRGTINPFQPSIPKQKQIVRFDQRFLMINPRKLI